MLSADGRCKTFDARANGYVRSEAVGALVVWAVEGGSRRRASVARRQRGAAGRAEREPDGAQRLGAARAAARGARARCVARRRRGGVRGGARDWDGARRSDGGGGLFVAAAGGGRARGGGALTVGHREGERSGHSEAPSGLLSSRRRLRHWRAGAGAERAARARWAPHVGAAVGVSGRLRAADAAERIAVRRGGRGVSSVRVQRHDRSRRRARRAASRLPRHRATPAARRAPPPSRVHGSECA